MAPAMIKTNQKPKSDSHVMAMGDCGTDHLMYCQDKPHKKAMHSGDADIDPTYNKCLCNKNKLYNNNKYVEDFNDMQQHSIAKEKKKRYPQRDSRAWRAASLSMDQANELPPSGEPFQQCPKQEVQNDQYGNNYQSGQFDPKEEYQRIQQNEYAFQQQQQQHQDNQQEEYLQTEIVDRQKQQQPESQIQNYPESQQQQQQQQQRIQKQQQIMQHQQQQLENLLPNQADYLHQGDDSEEYLPVYGGQNELEYEEQEVYDMPDYATREFYPYNEVQTYVAPPQKTYQDYKNTFEKVNNVEEKRQTRQKDLKKKGDPNSRYDRLNERFPTASWKMYNKYSDSKSKAIDDQIATTTDLIEQGHLNDTKILTDHHLYKKKTSSRSNDSKSSTRSNHSKKADELIKLEKSKCEAFTLIKEGIEKNITNEPVNTESGQKTATTTEENPNKSPGSPTCKTMEEILRGFRKYHLDNIIQEANGIIELEKFASKLTE